MHGLRLNQDGDKYSNFRQLGDKKNTYSRHPSELLAK